MEKKRDALNKNITSHKTEINRLTNERNEKTGPLYDKAAKLQKEIDAIEKPFDNSIRALKKRKTDDSNALRKVEQELKIKSWENRIPVGNDEIEEWFEVHDDLIFRGTSIWGIYPMRAPKVKSAKGYTTIAMSDSDGRPEYKAYVVLDDKGSVFASMVVDVAQHPGDNTQVSSVIIKGQDVQVKLGLDVWGVSKPVATFMDAVEAAIKQEAN